MQDRKFFIKVTLKAKCPSFTSSAIQKALLKTLSTLPKKVFNPLPKRVDYLICATVVTPKQIQKLNQSYRKKNKPTDVLSFSALDTKLLPTPEILLGDIYICWQVAKKQTKDFGTTPKQEIQRLAIHGLLHVFGYDHELGKKQAKKMFALQEKTLNAL